MVRPNDFRAWGSGLILLVILEILLPEENCRFQDLKKCTKIISLYTLKSNRLIVLLQD